MSGTKIKQFQSFNTISYKKNTVTKTKKTQTYREKLPFKPKFFCQILIDRFILNKIVGDECEYEYYDTSEVHVQV
jgi:hypothetical protein